MKISVNIKPIMFALVLAIGLLSCKKDDTPLRDLSGLSIVNAAPSTEKFDLFVDNTKVTTSDFTFGSKIDYLTAYSGTRRFTVTNKGSEVALKTETYVLEPQYGYTLFLLDRVEKLKFMLLPDNLTKPPKGKGSVRFANLSPDSDPLTLSIEGNPALITNISFQNYSNAIFIDAGDNVTFQVRDHINGNLIVSLSNIKIEEEKIYTIYVSGLKSATDATKLGAAIYTHK